MSVFGVNKIIRYCQAFSNRRNQPCPAKEINGELCFLFQREWHPISYITEHAEELVLEDGKLVTRPPRK